MTLLGVKKLRTTSYNPRSNGLTEKMNGVVKLYLLAFSNFVGGEWDVWCRECAFAYNSSVNRSTGFTPAELMYGRKFRIPLNILYNVKDNNKVTSFTEFKEKLTTMYEIARETMNTTQDRAFTYHDRKARDDVIATDTYVYVFMPRNRRLKIMVLKWHGPFKILEVLHPVYKVEIIDSKGKCSEKYVTRDKLRRAEKNATRKYVDAQESEETKSDPDDNEEEFDLDDLRDDAEDNTNALVNINRLGLGRYRLRPNPAIRQRMSGLYNIENLFCLTL